MKLQTLAPALGLALALSHLNPLSANESAPVDCPEPRSLLAVEHLTRLRAAAELGRCSAK